MHESRDRFSCPSRYSEFSSSTSNDISIYKSSQECDKFECKIALRKLTDALEEEKMKVKILESQIKIMALKNELRKCETSPTTTQDSCPNNSEILGLDGTETEAKRVNFSKLGSSTNRSQNDRRDCVKCGQVVTTKNKHGSLNKFCGPCFSKKSKIGVKCKLCGDYHYNKMSSGEFFSKCYSCFKDKEINLLYCSPYKK